MSKLRFSKQNAFVGHRQSVYCLKSDESEGFFSAGSEGKIVHWPSIDSTDGFLFAQLGEAIYSIRAINRDLVFAGTQSGKIYRLERNQEPLSISIFQNGVFDIEFDNLGQLWAGGGNGTLFQLTMNLEVVNKIQLSSKSIRSLEFDENNHWVAASSDGHLYHQHQPRQFISEMSIFQIKKSHSNEWICAGRDAQLRKLDSKFNEIQKINAHWFTIHALAFSPSGKYIASGSMDKSIRIWDAQNLDLLLSIGNRAGTIHKSSVNALIWMNEHTLISCSDDAQIYCWKIEFDTDI